MTWGSLKSHNSSPLQTSPVWPTWNPATPWALTWEAVITNAFEHYIQSKLFVSVLSFSVFNCSLFFNYRAEAISDEPWYWSKIRASLFVFCQWLSLGNNIKCSQIVAGAPWLGSPLFVFVLILGLIGSERTLTLVVNTKIQSLPHKYDLWRYKLQKGFK